MNAKACTIKQNQAQSPEDRITVELEKAEHILDYSILTMATFTLYVWLLLAAGHMTQGRVIDVTQGRVKRSDDGISTLTAVVDQLSAQVSSLVARQGSLETKQGSLDTRQGSLDTRLASLQHHAAFTAQFSVTGPKSQNAPLKFDKVIFNDGNAYDPLLGVFTAPFNGVYSFSAQVFTHVREESVVDIIVNGQVMSRMRADSLGHEEYAAQSNLTTLVVKLTKGSKVWVQVPQGHGLDFYNIFHSFFNGALLYPQ